MSRNKRSVIAEHEPHPTDPFHGRPHKHKASDEVARIRLLQEADLQNTFTQGRPGVDYRIQFNYQDSGVLTPKQYKEWELLPRGEGELSAIKMYDWLMSQGVPLISNIDLVSNWETQGVAIVSGTNYITNQPAVHLRFRSRDERSFGKSVEALLRAAGVFAPLDLDSDGLHIELHAWDIDNIPA